MRALAAALVLTVAIAGVSGPAQAQTASVSPTSVILGQTVTASWSGFSGNVNVAVYKGSTFWVHANIDLPPSGSWPMDTIGWEVRSDYRIRVELRSNPSIFATSQVLAVNAPSVSASVSPLSVQQGQTVTASWSGFPRNINLEVWRGGSLWVLANADIPGSGSQALVTSVAEGWQIRSDYQVKVVLRANTSIFATSQTFAVTAPCVNDCSSGTQCLNSSTQQTCGNYDGDSCLEWGGDQFCPNGCSGGACVAGCTNDCSSSGQTRCVDGTNQQTCGNYDGDSCLEWSGNQFCTSGCVGNACAGCTVPAPPNLIMPPSGGTVAPGNVTFTWGMSSGANRYRLKVATDPAMSANISGSPFDQLPPGVLEYTVSLPAGTYYWQVGAISSNESCGWGVYGPSPPWSLNVGTVPSCNYNQTKEPGEECDGSDHGVVTCSAFAGFDCGSLSCVDCRFDTSDCRRSECTTDVGIRCSADGTRLEQCMKQLNGCRVLFATESCPTGCFADTCVTAIYLDWDTPLDVNISWDTTCKSDHPPGSMPLAGFSDTEKGQIRAELEAILNNSRVAIPVIDGGSLPSAVVHVRFSSAIQTNPKCGLLLGTAYDGINRCNRRRSNRVAVFGVPGTPLGTPSIKLIAETVAHEAGHALGLKHINPYPDNPIEVMDYEDDDLGVEQFTTIRTEVREPPWLVCSDNQTHCGSDSDCPSQMRPCANGQVETFETASNLIIPQTHNPAYHLAAFTLGRSVGALRSEGLEPGTWDTGCYGPIRPYLARIMSFALEPSMELYDVAVWQRLGSQPVVFGSVDRNWNPLKYIGDVTDASEIEIVWDRSLPLQIAASSQRGGVRDLVFGLGDPQNPQLTFRTSIGGLVQGSIFYFDTPGGAPTVVGSFTGLVAPVSCGNGVLDAGEECDDGNAVAGDGCEPVCTLTECPCSGPPTGGSWENHGAYRRCVAQATKVLPYVGIMTKEQRRTILRAAGRSTCGHAEKTRCCVPTKTTTKCKILLPDRCAVKGGIDIGDGSCIPNPCL